MAGIRINKAGKIKNIKGRKIKKVKNSLKKKKKIKEISANLSIHWLKLYVDFGANTRKQNVMLGSK